MSRTTRSFALLVPLVLVAAPIGGIQPAVAQLACVPLPDAQIRGGPADLSYIGNTLHSHDALEQTLQRQVRPGFGDQFNINIKNDSTCADSFFVHGASSTMKFRISYWYGALNVTADVVAGTFKTVDLAPGSSDYLMAFIYVKRGVRSGSWITNWVSVTSSAGAGRLAALDVWDVVGARVLVNRHAGDFNSQFPIP